MIIITRMLTAALLGLLTLGPALAETPVSGNSTLGTYLSARLAQDLRDTPAANVFLKTALERDPSNPALLGQAFIFEVIGGDWAKAVDYAKRTGATDPNNQLAHLALGVDAFKAGRLGDAEKQFSEPGNTPIAVMARAWVLSAKGDTKAALALLGTINDPNWIGFFRKYQTALLDDISGDTAAAGKLYEELFGSNPATINVALAYARHASHGGNNTLAKEILAKHTAAVRAPHPLIEAADEALRQDRTLALDTTTSTDGLASVFYSFSQAINGQGGIDLALIYSQFALQLRPDDQLTMVQLAAIFEQLKQYDNAIAVYRRLPATSPLQFDVKVREGLNLNALDKTDEAKAALKAIAEPAAPDPVKAAKEASDLHAEIEKLDGLALHGKGERVKRLQGWLDQLGYASGPSDGNFGAGTRDAVVHLQKDAGLPETGQLGPQTRKALEVRLAALAAPQNKPLGTSRQIDLYQTIGNMLRGRKEFAEAADYYTKAIALIGKPSKENWDQFYSRAVCYERMNQWAKAEPDFKTALDLSPDEPLILNYLGYSWVDRNEHIDQALALIKKAVSLKPDDGYYIDSLGWAYFRLGRYDEAVEQLERAVELKAEDPTINDHLGDAYWRAGRHLEAQFQWSTSLTSKPEPAEIPKLQAKMKDGLPPDPKAPPPAATNTTGTNGSTAGAPAKDKTKQP
jgi:tetratricopeptide (TPR) repeat protein